MRHILLILLLVSGGCATAGLPASFLAMQRMQIRELAGHYPSDFTVKGDSHRTQYKRLAEWAEDNGIVVTEAGLARRSLRGSVQPGYGGWVILIEREQPPNAKLSTLLHELGHVFGPKGNTELEREVIAEMIAAMACEAVGLDMWPQATSYLAYRVPALDTQMSLVARVGAGIDNTAKALAKIMR